MLWQCYKHAKDCHKDAAKALYTCCKHAIDMQKHAIKMLQNCYNNNNNNLNCYNMKELKTSHE